MGIEIERKFLLKHDGWRAQAGAGSAIVQGYLVRDPARTVRVRIAGDHAFLTVKGVASGAARAEFEYPIPIEDAQVLLDTLCLSGVIAKTRYRVPIDDVVWEIDEFHGANAGLILAEVELPHEHHPITLPDWVGDEVTTDPRYTNAVLSIGIF